MPKQIIVGLPSVQLITYKVKGNWSFFNLKNCTLLDIVMFHLILMNAKACSLGNPLKAHKHALHQGHKLVSMVPAAS